ncbi:MAG: DUF935 domain-containing protein [Gemmatales bacterium]|nr:DUF935 domain-containing protein [Gemmatales bacterium]MDW8222266.1 DUF935 family protein [Gemmatales bacterium]
MRWWQRLQRWWQTRGKVPAERRAGRFFAEKLAEAFRREPYRLLPWYDEGPKDPVQWRSIVRKMLAEPTVKAGLLQKVAAVASLDLHVHPAHPDRRQDRQAARFVFDVLTQCAGGLRKICEAILLPALLDGYSVAEKVWMVQRRGPWAGKIVLRDLKAKDPSWLRLETDEFHNVRAIVSADGRQRFEPQDFVILRYLALYEHPYGTSDLWAAYRAWWTLDTAWKLRLLALERFSQPLLLGRYPAHRSDWQSALEQALREARHAGYITLPEGVEIIPLTLAGRNAEDFAQAVRDLRHEIYLSITGALLHGLEGLRTGARCLGEVHRSTAELLVWHLAQLVSDALNSQLVPDLVQLNFAYADVPRVQLVGVNDRELLASWQVDRGLLSMGLPLSRSSLYLRYGRQAPLEPQDQLPGERGCRGLESRGDSCPCADVADQGVSRRRTLQA